MPNKEQITAADAKRHLILAAALERAPFDGWTDKTLKESVSAANVGAPEATLLFPRGIDDLLTYWNEGVNRSVLTRAELPDFAALKVREKVAVLVESRLDALTPHKEAARRAAATLALPTYAPLGARLAWRASDTIWRALNDKSTDFNFYSKRAILTGVWTSTFARWLSDQSEDGEATRSFLADRIENVMQIEKIKAGLREHADAPRRLIAALAQMRYR